MERLADRLGLEVEFVAAVDGRNLSAAQRALYDPEYARLVYGCDMTDAEIACYLSHHSIYQKMIDENIALSLVLEDDIDCDDDFAEVLQELLAAPDPEWAVVRLQSTKSSVCDPQTVKTRGVKLADVRGRSLCRIETSVLGGCGYLIRRTAAQIMLTYGARIFMPIDQALDRYWENGILPYVVRPFPVWQHEGFNSAIGTRGRDVPADLNALHVARRRARRAFDGLNKRLFSLARREPRWAEVLAKVGVPCARLALAPLPIRSNRSDRTKRALI